MRRSTADRIAALERKLSPVPPPPGPPTIYCAPGEVSEIAERLAIEGAQFNALLPRTVTLDEWERYAVESQQQAATRAAARVREILGESERAVPDNVLPMAR